MVDHAGKLTGEDIEKVKRHLKERGVTFLRCPECRKDAAYIQNYTAVLPISGPQMHPITGKAFPQVVVECGNCSHTRFFNAVLLGLFPGSEDG